MRLPLPTLCDADLLRAHAATRASLDGFRQATLRRGSLIQSWVGRAGVVALEHYPPGGVVDRQRGLQFFSTTATAPTGPSMGMHTCSGMPHDQAGGGVWRQPPAPTPSGAAARPRT